MFGTLSRLIYRRGFVSQLIVGGALASTLLAWPSTPTTHASAGTVYRYFHGAFYAMDGGNYIQFQFVGNRAIGFQEHIQVCLCLPKQRFYQLSYRTFNYPRNGTRILLGGGAYYQVVGSMMMDHAARPMADRAQTVDWTATSWPAWEDHVMHTISDGKTPL